MERSDPRTKASPGNISSLSKAGALEGENHELLPIPLGRAADEDLMRRAQQGDRQAFGLLYERYSSAILSYLFRLLGNIEDVESIAQEVFVRAFRFRETYRFP